MATEQDLNIFDIDKLILKYIIIAHAILNYLDFFSSIHAEKTF